MALKAALCAVLIGVASSHLLAQTSATVDSVPVDFTGDGSPEIWKLDTLGMAGDSLRITMSIISAGKTLYTELCRWRVSGVE